MYPVMLEIKEWIARNSTMALGFESNSPTDRCAQALQIFPGQFFGDTSCSHLPFIRRRVILKVPAEV